MVNNTLSDIFKMKVKYIGNFIIFPQMINKKKKNHCLNQACLNFLLGQ